MADVAPAARRAMTASRLRPFGLGATDARAWCRELPARAGVVAIPTSGFYDDEEAGRTLVRFAYCKRPAVIETAVTRLMATVGAAH